MCPQNPQVPVATGFSSLCGLRHGAMGQQTLGSSRSLLSLPGWTHPVQIGLSFLVPVELFYFYFGFLVFFVPACLLVSPSAMHQLFTHMYVHTHSREQHDFNMFPSFFVNKCTNCQFFGFFFFLVCCFVLVFFFLIKGIMLDVLA